MNSILGICIPTYNRADILKENLENLISKVSQYEVPIYVSDNNSEDNTEDVVLELKKKYQYITYSKNPENIGSAKNFEKVLSMCGTKYAWLLGDDDTISGEVKDVLDILGQDQWDVVVFGVLGNLGGSKAYHDIHSVFTDLLGAMTWISALIVNEDIIKKMISKNHPNPHFAHTGALMEVLDESPKVYYYFDSVMVQAMSNELVDWANKAFDIFSGSWIDYVLSYPEKYSMQEKRKAIINLPSSPWRWRILLLYRAKGFFDHKRLIRQRDKILLVSKRHYLAMCCISLMPKFIAMLILNSGLIIKGALRKIHR